MGAIAEWVETLHGHGELSASLTKLVTVMRANAALLLRFTADRITPKHVAVAELRSGELLAPKRRSFFRDILDDCPSVFQSGKIVTLSDLADDGAIDLIEMTGLRSQLAQHGLRDIAAIPLSSEAQKSDFLELQFSAEIPDHDKNLLTMMSSTLAITWQGRLPGTADRSISRNSNSNIHELAFQSNLPILDVSNPLALSRCEYRVCTMVMQGKLVKSIAASLKVQDSTVRSHLRSIYQKTGTTCHVELLHKLTTQSKEMSDGQSAIGDPIEPNIGIA